MVRIFNDKEVDKLMVLDIAASRERREPNLQLVKRFAAEAFMPLTYAGGIRSVDHACRPFTLGIEKDVSLLTTLPEQFVCQSVLVSIDVKRDWRKRHRRYASATGRLRDGDWREYLQRTMAAGAGEMVVIAVGRDGTMAGFDLDVGQMPVIPLLGRGSCGVDHLSAVRRAPGAHTQNRNGQA